MNRVLEHLEPGRVFYYFEELTRIPHGSGDTKAISDYCVNFAKERGLSWYQDALNNVIIIKEATEGYEQASAVMVQGHLDMVNEKETDCTHDFSKDPLQLQVEGDFISAAGTTLGGDDGIAIAYALALLEAEDIPHPRLECVFTVDEEVGMEGAAAIDLSMLQSKYLLNVDSEEEGIFLSSCAGGVRYDLQLPVSWLPAEGYGLTLSVEGLFGGHSGTEIDKGRANANILMGRVLHDLSTEFTFCISAMAGGQKDNAITRECQAELLLAEEDLEDFLETVKDLEAELLTEYGTADPGLRLTVTKQGEREMQVLHPIAQEKVLFLLMNVPHGVQAMSMDIPGLVQTSLNLGVLTLTEEVFSIRLALRSSVKSAKKALRRKLEYLIEFLGGEYSFSGDYPAWEYKKDSKLRQLMADTYEELFHKPAQIQAIHAGLECGILGDKLPGLDCVSLGPDMHDIHTPKERLSISSAARVWELLKTVLGRMKEL